MSSSTAVNTFTVGGVLAGMSMSGIVNNWVATVVLVK